jgi:hypothetical protein
MPAKVEWLGPMRQAKSAHKYIAVLARPGIADETRAVEERAQANLEAARATPAQPVIHELGRMRVYSEMGVTDGRVYLEGDGAMAAEFGHAPSGVFAGTSTKAPAGLYILTRAR